MWPPLSRASLISTEFDPTRTNSPVSSPSQPWRLARSPTRLALCGSPDKHVTYKEMAESAKSLKSRHLPEERGAESVTAVTPDTRGKGPMRVSQPASHAAKIRGRVATSDFSGRSIPQIRAIPRETRHTGVAEYASVKLGSRLGSQHERESILPLQLVLLK